MGWGLLESALPQCPSLQEGMLRDLQKSVEEEEQVWKAKVSAKEEELQKVQHGPSEPPRGPATRASHWNSDITYSSQRAGSEFPTGNSRGKADRIIWEMGVTFAGILVMPYLYGNVIMKVDSSVSRRHPSRPLPGRGCWVMLGVGEHHWAS